MVPMWSLTNPPLNTACKCIESHILAVPLLAFMLLYYSLHQFLSVFLFASMSFTIDIKAILSALSISFILDVRFRQKYRVFIFIFLILFTMFLIIHDFHDGQLTSGKINMVEFSRDEINLLQTP